jgi:hypothetical protein
MKYCRYLEIVGMAVDLLRAEPEEPTEENIREAMVRAAVHLAGVLEAEEKQGLVEVMVHAANKRWPGVRVRAA